MRLLELFKGTGSVGQTFLELYPNGEVISLDFDPTCNATHTCNILDFDYSQYPVGYFDILWASPDCRIFSILQEAWVGRKYTSREELESKRRESWKYVERVIEIVNYLEPARWFIENPWTSKMKDIPCLSDIRSFRFDYCRYNFAYKKPTRIWSNLQLSSNICQCTQSHQLDIGTGRNSRHKWNAYISLHHPELQHTNKVKARRDLAHRIPPDLIIELFNS